MKMDASCLIALVLAAAFIAAPAAAGLISPHRLPQVSAPRTFLAGFNANDPATIQPFKALVQGMNLTPAPIPQMTMYSFNGKYQYNWGSDRFKPGGKWIE